MHVALYLCIHVSTFFRSFCNKKRIRSLSNLQKNSKFIYLNIKRKEIVSNVGPIVHEIYIGASNSEVRALK